jgi:hypothetical protein
MKVTIHAGILLGHTPRMARTWRVEATMTKYLAGVLTVIAAGVLLIAYGLLNPGATADAASAMSPVMAPVATSEPVAMRMPISGGYGYAFIPAGAYVPAGAAAGFAAQSGSAAPYGGPSYVQPGYAQAAPAQSISMTEPDPRAVRTVSYEPVASRRAATNRVVERKPQRNWKRTALIIGGASAAGAGVGAMVGGRKGALIGAAVGGGASTIYQTTRSTDR